MISFILQAETATQDILDWLNEQIDVEDLPQMFQDADSGVGQSLFFLQKWTLKFANLIQF